MTSRAIPTWDPHRETTAKLLARGWRWWDEDETLLLCPLEDFERIRDGVVLTGIFGKKKTKGRDEIDVETRAGLIAWGVPR